MTEIEVIDKAMTVEVARALTDQIRGTLRDGHDLITAAFTGRAWVALGYVTWDAYCEGEFSDARMVRLPLEQRREIVAEMTTAGMSTRAIASGIGVARNTVKADQREQAGQVDPPAQVTGTDGKTYTRSARGPAVPDVAQAEVLARTIRRKPLRDTTDLLGEELRRVARRANRLAADDRLPRADLGDHPGLHREAREALAAITHLLNQFGAGAPVAGSEGQ